MAALRDLRRRWRADSGAELVEFALTMPLLLLLVLGIIEFGFLFQQYEVVTNAAREGARIRVLPTYTQQDAINRVNDYLNKAGLTASLATAVITGPTSAPISDVGTCITTFTVDVTYPHTVAFVGGIMSYLGGALPGTINLKAKSTMRSEGVAGSCP
jgi:Flp pilus assembly protein TadG